MLIIKINAESNGAHANQSVNGTITLPDGWVGIPSELEATAQSYLPFIKLTITDGVVTAAEDDIEARAAWVEPEADIITQPTEAERIVALEEAMLEILMGG